MSISHVSTFPSKTPIVIKADPVFRYSEFRRKKWAKAGLSFFHVSLNLHISGQQQSDRRGHSSWFSRLTVRLIEPIVLVQIWQKSVLCCLTLKPLRDKHFNI
jgi:hypothetical protein